jgi:excisionase family DNA binding protein
MTPERIRPPEDDLRAFSINETAQRLNLSEVHVRRMIKLGRLRVRREGSRVLIPASAIREYLEPEPKSRKR